MDNEIKIEVDLTNPGQYFAGCGLLELAAKLSPEALGWFDGAGNFCLAHTPPLTELLAAIVNAKITALDDHDIYASPLQIGKPFNLRLDWWKNAAHDTSALKTWAGTMEGPRIARALQRAVKTLIETSNFAPEKLFTIDGVADTDDGKKVEPFYFDAKRAVDARDVGFSPNDIKWETYATPAVELLCLVGLQRAVPAPLGKPRQRQFVYHGWTRPLPITLIAAAVNGLLPDVAPAYCFESWRRDDKHKAFKTACHL
ncbi:type I-U CRISPR-associated protein Cas8c [Planctomycetales bacterium]|nr:type I-U CRISPR-associated protein Cas8c [Planctomycetales bacterium]